MVSISISRLVRRVGVVNIHSAFPTGQSCRPTPWKRVRVKGVQRIYRSAGRSCICRTWASCSCVFSFPCRGCHSLLQCLKGVGSSTRSSNTPNMEGDIAPNLLIKRRQKGGGQLSFHNTFDGAGKTQQTGKPPDLEVRELRQLLFGWSHRAWFVQSTAQTSCPTQRRGAARRKKIYIYISISISISISITVF